MHTAPYAQANIRPLRFRCVGIALDYAAATMVDVALVDGSDVYNVTKTTKKLNFVKAIELHAPVQKM